MIIMHIHIHKDKQDRIKMMRKQKKTQNHLVFLNKQTDII
jgi:hypothetical protein